MKLCYCDETGMGNEPIAIMVGVIVDAQRMHVTKQHWRGLLATLSAICGHELAEIHTRDFYSGSGVWREMEGPDSGLSQFLEFRDLAWQRPDPASMRRERGPQEER